MMEFSAHKVHACSEMETVDRLSVSCEKSGPRKTQLFTQNSTAGK